MAIVWTIILANILFVGIKYYNVTYLLRKYGQEGKNFFIVYPSWWTLLCSVKVFDPKDYIEEKHILYKMEQGMPYDEAEFEEGLIVFEMEMVKHEHNFVTNYCSIENGRVIVQPMDEYLFFMRGWLEGMRGIENISDED